MVGIITKDIFDLNDKNDVCRKETTEDLFLMGKDADKSSEETGREYSIIYQGAKHPIRWKTINWLDSGGMSCGAVKTAYKRNIDLFVLHFDVCLNSSSCAKVLKERGLGVHFLLDNDGTIYQLADLADITYHCKGENERSVGVEISNAYYPKYIPWYRQHYMERPIIVEDIIHGEKLNHFLGYYPVQEEALAYLLKTVCELLFIPLEVPRDLKNNVIKTILPSAELAKYNGIVGHYMVTTNKIDPAGLNFDKILKRAKEL